MSLVTEECNEPFFKQMRSLRLEHMLEMRKRKIVANERERKHQMIQELGNSFCQYLDSQTISLSGEDDGRLESLRSEKEITNQLLEKFPEHFPCKKTHNRSFGDIVLHYKNEEYPINVKMVNDSRSGTFNAGGPSLIHWILFGGGQISWNALAKKIKNRKPLSCKKKYYYLIYFKNSSRKSVFINLTNICSTCIVTNPSNPLQLCRKICPSSYVERTDSEKVDFVVSLFISIIKKRAEAYLILLQ